MSLKSDKTKKLIIDTLVKLMGEKDFDKITVKDLTDALDINRGTFYLHYKDKYDLLEQIENEILGEINEIVVTSQKKLTSGFIFPANEEAVLNTFISIYRYINENADFMKIILGPNGDLSFQMKIRNLVEDWLVLNVPVSDAAEKLPIKYLAAIASSAQLGIIQKWLKSGMKETPEELASFVRDIISSIYKGVIKDLIENPYYNKKG